MSPFWLKDIPILYYLWLLRISFPYQFKCEFTQISQMLGNDQSHSIPIFAYIYILYLKPRSSTFCWWFSQFSPYFIHVADGFPIFVQPSARSGCHETWQLLNQNPQKFSAAQTSERWWLDHESAPGSRKSDLCIKIYAYTHTHTHIYVCVSVLVYMHIIVCVYIYNIIIYRMCLLYTYIHNIIIPLIDEANMYTYTGWEWYT